MKFFYYLILLCAFLNLNASEEYDVSPFFKKLYDCAQKYDVSCPHLFLSLHAMQNIDEAALFREIGDILQACSHNMNAEEYRDLEQQSDHFFKNIFLDEQESDFAEDVVTRKAKVKKICKLMVKDLTVCGKLIACSGKIFVL